MSVTDTPNDLCKGSICSTRTGVTDSGIYLGPIHNTCKIVPTLVQCVNPSHVRCVVGVGLYVGVAAGFVVVIIAAVVASVVLNRRYVR